MDLKHYLEIMYFTVVSFLSCFVIFEKDYGYHPYSISIKLEGWDIFDE